jgi:hypothetical protein
VVFLLTDAVGRTCGGRIGLQGWLRRHEEGACDRGNAPGGGAVARVWRLRRRNRTSGGSSGVGRME